MKQPAQTIRKEPTKGRSSRLDQEIKLLKYGTSAEVSVCSLWKVMITGLEVWFSIRMVNI
uniref:Uncharacterized protein n=1 Tax=Rhodnius prolixus TaxID=13249 RepID=T1I728_RHOPR